MPARVKRKPDKEAKSANPPKPKKQISKAKKGVAGPEISNSPSIVAKPKVPKAASEKVLYTHWLMKSEPESRFENGVDVKFGINELKASPNQTAPWDGVRNYQVSYIIKMFFRLKLNSSLTTVW